MKIIDSKNKFNSQILQLISQQQCCEAIKKKFIYKFLQWQYQQYSKIWQNLNLINFILRCQRVVNSMSFLQIRKQKYYIINLSVCLLYILVYLILLRVELFSLFFYYSCKSEGAIIVYSFEFIRQPLIFSYYIIFCVVMMSEAGGFGRPEDKDIEKQFMKKIRGDKLQAINAECELQICLAFKYPKTDKTKNKKSKKKESKEENQLNQIKLEAFNIPGLDVNRRERLHGLFGQIKEKWKFQQIPDGQPLPQFFFDDGCDLSFILHELMNVEEEEFKVFSPSQLIFLQILCLQGRRLLSQNIVTYFQQNIDFMISAMQNGLDKIAKKLQTRKNEKMAKNKLKIENGEQPSENNHDQYESKNIQSEQPKKTKPIKKESGGKKSKGKKKKNSSQDEQSDDGMEGESEPRNYPGDTELALKTCNYICWAYWYIIKKD